MKSDLFATTLVLAIALTMCHADHSPTLKIATRRSDDRIEVKPEDGRVVLVVRSPSGISQATIERITEQWPDTLVIQLRLNGLEYFKVSTDELKLEASVSSHIGKVRLWKDGESDSPLNPMSPYWMEIRILERDGKPTRAIPIKDGCFEMQLPQKFFEGNPRLVRVEWIDFYRD